MISVLYRLLLTLLLVQFSSSSSPPRGVWECTGPQSKYSFLDCERDYSYSDGCYYVEHFSQFRPCAWICNDIEFNSIDEERCRAFCSAYLKQQCRLEIPRITSSKPLTTCIPHSNAFTEVKVTRRDLEAAGTNVLLVVVTPVVIVLVIGVGAFALIHLYSTLKQAQKSNSKTVNCSARETKTLQNSVTCQPEEFPTEASGDNWLNKKLEEADYTTTI